jgi:hypothetical protein
MRRRDFILGIIGGPALPPVIVNAQQSSHVRGIGVLLFTDQDRAIIAPMFRELQDFGYVDGKTVDIEYRDAAGDYARLPELPS